MYTLDKINKIVLAEPTESVARAISALEEGSFTKIICGAANTNSKQVERLAFVYSLSGADAIDISSSKDVIEAAKIGIKKALELYNKNPEKYPKFKEPVLMVSLNTGDDLHFKKAEINPDKCVNCLECISSCPAKALSSENNLLRINKDNCFGCGKCSEACLQNAINFIKLDTVLDNNFEDIKAVEIHTGPSSIEEVKNFLESKKSILKNIELLSFSVESKLFNHKELEGYVNDLVNLVQQKVIIQIDGASMRANNKDFSSLEAITAGAVLLNKDLNAYVQLSGGTNHLTKKLIRQSGLKNSGIGYGTFARKIILSYLEGLEDLEFVMELKRILNITTSLVEN